MKNLLFKKNQNQVSKFPILKEVILDLNKGKNFVDFLYLKILKETKLKSLKISSNLIFIMGNEILNIID